MRPRLWFVLICLFVGTASARADIVWGANGHPITSYPGVTIEQQLDYLRDLGMKAYRVDITDAKGASVLSRLVQEGKARDIAILPVVTPGHINLDTDTPEEIYRTAYELAFTLGSEFKDDIRVWELGNELENYAIIAPCEKRDDGTQYPCQWGPAGGVTALEYYGPRWAKVSAVLKGLSDGMTAADPTIRKAMGTAGWGHIGAFERMQHDGIRWDISVWHIYGEDPEWAFAKLAQFKRPIWVTEFGNPRGSQEDEQQQAAGVSQMISRLRALKDRYNIEAAYIYELMDESYWAPDAEAFQGLVRLVDDGNGSWRAGEPKPAYFAARELIRGPVPPPTPNRECELPAWEGGPVSTSSQVEYSYCLVLGRGSDGAGLESWVNSLEAQTTSITDMLIAMLDSPEFADKYGIIRLSDRDYISLLFQLLLDRDPDDAGLEAYARELKTGEAGRASVAAGIILSEEFRELHPILFAPPPPADGTSLRASR